MFGIGSTEIIIILLVALIVIGPRRFPEIARALGRSYREFQRSLDNLRQSIDLDEEEPEPPKPHEEEPKLQSENESQPDDVPRTS